MDSLVGRVPRMLMVLVSMVGCGDEEPSPPSAEDTAASADAGGAESGSPTDSAADDGGGSDSGTTDSGTTDSGTGDTGGSDDCSNGVDDNGNGLVDCEDSRCWGVGVCEETDCADGLDDESDGLTDCADEDCWGTSACPTATIASRVLGSGPVQLHKERQIRYKDCYGPGVYVNGTTIQYTATASSVWGTIRGRSTVSADPVQCLWTQERFRAEVKLDVCKFGGSADDRYNAGSSSFSTEPVVVSSACPFDSAAVATRIRGAGWPRPIGEVCRFQQATWPTYTSFDDARHARRCGDAVVTSEHGASWPNGGVFQGRAHMYMSFSSTLSYIRTNGSGTTTMYQYTWLGPTGLAGDPFFPSIYGSFVP